VHPDEFAIPLEHLQPARKRTTAVSRLRPVAPMHSAVAPANRPAADASTLPAAHVTASPEAVRAWARANGHEVGDRGRLPPRSPAPTAAPTRPSASLTTMR